MDFEVVCDGLKFPEGPVWMKDGSVIVVELAAGVLSRIRPDGSKEIVAETGGGPNGAAIGPDGAVYVTNSGGMVFTEDDGVLFTDGSAPDDYQSGSIQRVDLDSGEVRTLYTKADGRDLRAPNDLVFDADGGMWFTDLGKHLGEARYPGGLFYAQPDGSEIRRVADGIDANGIGLSPDGKRLYTALTYERLVLEFDVKGPGDLEPQMPPGRVVASFPGRQWLDSLAVTEDGHVCVGSLFDMPGIVSVDPESGEYVDHPLHDVNDVYVTNICFGGEDMRDAWITLSTTGKLLKTRWERPGLRLSFYA